MKRYRIHEIFYSIQGEGYFSGTPSIFIRFSGCNMWNGREEDRDKAKSEICRHCDTDFRSYKELSLEEILARLGALPRTEHIVLTGGEPCLQVDPDLVQTLKDRYHIVQVETNGTVPCAVGNTARVWITASPKIDWNLKVVPKEVKVILPGPVDPRACPYGPMAKYVQPLWTDDGYEKGLKACLEFLKEYPDWQLSLQIHKLVGLL